MQCNHTTYYAQKWNVIHHGVPPQARPKNYSIWYNSAFATAQPQPSTLRHGTYHEPARAAVEQRPNMDDLQTEEKGQLESLARPQLRRWANLNEYTNQLIPQPCRINEHNPATQPLLSMGEKQLYLHRVIHGITYGNMQASDPFIVLSSARLDRIAQSRLSCTIMYVHEHVQFAQV